MKGKKAHFVLGWCGLATTDEGHNTTDSLFKVLYEMDAVELSIEDIAGHLERLATAHFVNLKPLDKRGLFVMGGWQQSEPFVCTVLKFDSQGFEEAWEVAIWVRLFTRFSQPTKTPTKLLT